MAKAILTIFVFLIFFSVNGALKLIDNFGLGLPLQNQYQVIAGGLSSLTRPSHPFVLQPIHTSQDDVQVSNPYVIPETSPKRRVRASAKQAAIPGKRFINRTKKKKNKNKIMFKYANTAISGGSRLKKTFRSLKGCMSACNKRPNCLSADYNKKTGFCYTHYDTTCNTREAQHGTTHFSKIPCENDLDVPGGLNAEVYIGLHRDNGRLDKSVKSFGQCMKNCLNMGNGLATATSTMREEGQVCSAIDYDFAQHKCYYHTRLRYSQIANANQFICRVPNLVLTATTGYPMRELSPLAHNVHLLLCPDDDNVPP